MSKGYKSGEGKLRESGGEFGKLRLPGKIRFCPPRGTSGWGNPRILLGVQITCHDTLQHSLKGSNIRQTPSARITE
jgi:hypothetical protein